MPVLVTGGASGYLGQFIVAAVAQTDQVVATWMTSNPGTPASSNIKYVQCDQTDPHSLGKLFREQTINVVVNTAALSQPAACETNPAAARALNIPQSLLLALQEQKTQKGIEALLIHISTDQVYDGSRSFWQEDSETAPVNEYARSKLLAEDAIRTLWPKHYILRSSIIYGPLPPVPVARMLFVQFVEQSLRLSRPCKFFSDEYRSPIMVHDLARVVVYFLHESGAGTLGTYNAGGPQRLSRADMAHAIAVHCGIDPARVDVAESAVVKRAAPSPLDISMNSSKLQKQIPFQLQTFAAALKDVFPVGQQPQRDASMGANSD